MGALLGATLRAGLNPGLRSCTSSLVEDHEASRPRVSSGGDCRPPAGPSSATPVVGELGSVSACAAQHQRAADVVTRRTRSVSSLMRRFMESNLHKVTFKK